ncbi:MAG: poly-beta-1,6-N-acetyl-D-glucosamine biosynthesis protein PgaD [Burkholderiales bacterium]
MDKSRSRSAADKLIIDKPELQTSRQRVLFGAATVTAWVMWVYLWLPIITLVGWYFGVRRFRDVMVTNSGAVHFAQVVGWYALIIVGICGALVCWALYNWARFHDAKRRVVDPASVSADEMVERTHVSSEVLACAQMLRIMTVQHDAHGVIVGIDSPQNGHDSGSTLAAPSRAAEVEAMA